VQRRVGELLLELAVLGEHGLDGLEHAAYRWSVSCPCE